MKENSMSNVKVYKKGDIIFRDGDKIQSVQMIQSGGVSTCFIRPKKNVELFQVGPSHILGEVGLVGGSTHPYSAIATAETKVLEIPVDVFKQQVDAGAQSTKILIKSLIERLKQALSDVKSNRMEKDSSPCPEDQVAKIFGTIYHTARHKGTKEVLKEKKQEVIAIDWLTMKQYGQRIFTESPKRMEQALTLLMKLQWVQFEMGKAVDNPDGPDELQRVLFFDLPAIESFFEFYQYYYFKGGRGEVLRVEESMYNLLSKLLQSAEGLEADRFGIVSIDYTKLIEKFKTDFSMTLNNDHFSRLEQKGVFVKRAARTDGVVVMQFEVKELSNVLKSWKVLREIEKWNEKGFIDLNEKEEVKKKLAPGAQACPQCQSEIAAQAKFCSECGYKVAA
jgi:CRP-like cAMP-binding protein